MHDFIARHASKITGVLRGFDRLLFRGHLTRLSYPAGVEAFVRGQGALKKEFDEMTKTITGLIRYEAESLAEKLGRPTIYLQSSTARKEDVARGTSGNTSKPASCGHFKTGQSRVADARYLTVPPGEARGLRSAI